MSIIIFFIFLLKFSYFFQFLFYGKYIRINYLKHVLDESKDNTLVIKLVSTSDPSIRIGYPGPSNRFSSHTVTKIND